MKYRWGEYPLVASTCVFRQDQMLWSAFSKKPVTGSVPDAYTEVLSNFNGTDGAQTYTDDTMLVWSVGAGGAGENELDTAQKKFGSASLYLPSTSSAAAYVTTDLPASTWSGDWTAEMFIRFSAMGGGSFVIADSVAGDGHTILQFSDLGDSFLLLFTHSKLDDLEIVNLSDTVTPGAADTWHHVAIVYDASEITKFSLYANGVRIAQGNSSGGVSDYLLSTMNLTTDNNGDVWMDSFRFSTSVRYSGATYVVPTVEFTV